MLEIFHLFSWVILPLGVWTEIHFEAVHLCFVHFQMRSKELFWVVARSADSKLWSKLWEIHGLSPHDGGVATKGKESTSHSSLLSSSSLRERSAPVLTLRKLSSVQRKCTHVSCLSRAALFQTLSSLCKREKSFLKQSARKAVLVLED